MLATPCNDQIASKTCHLLATPVRETRNAAKIIFKVPTRITPKYEKVEMDYQVKFNVQIVYLNIKRRLITCIQRPVKVQRIRDWSFITGRGGATKLENRGSETFCAPPSRQGKTFCAPPPF